MTKSPLKIIFAGTPEFAAVALRTLLENHHEIMMVYTQPDRPSGRGQHLHMSPVKQIAMAHQIPLRQPTTLRDEKEQLFFQNLKADIMVVAAYGLILPKSILTAPHLGCINIHASLLPRWRGASPIQHAILAGDKETGVSIMKMDEGLDTGPVLYKIPCPIGERDTSQIVHDRLAKLGAEAFLMVLTDLRNDIIKQHEQDNAHATHAPKITKQQAQLNWEKNAIELDRMIRAFNPTPVAFTQIEDHTVRVWQALPYPEILTSEKPGTIVKILKEGIDVATGQGLLRLIQIQLPGAKPLPIADVLNAKKSLFQIGSRFV